MNTVLVTGANGQLGSEIKALAENHSHYNFIFTDVEDLDICNYKMVKQLLDSNNVKVIINCAAYTAVDKAEDDATLADKINHLAVANFAQIAKDQHIKLIHISTDYVFDGKAHRPYSETDTPNPESVYGTTKRAGEQAMQAINPANSIIIRTSWVYSAYGSNFVKTMLRLANDRDEIPVVADQIGTPTYAADLAAAILSILPKLDNDKVEVFHYSNEGVCSWYDFAKAVFEIIDIPINAKPIPASHYPTPAPRPFYSVLDKTKIKEKYQIEIPYWRESLIHCLNNIEL